MPTLNFKRHLEMLHALVFHMVQNSKQFTLFDSTYFLSDFLN